jgi:hypothetical protein
MKIVHFFSLFFLFANFLCEIFFVEKILAQNYWMIQTTNKFCEFISLDVRYKSDQSNFFKFQVTKLIKRMVREQPTTRSFKKGKRRQPPNKKKATFALYHGNNRFFFQFNFL